MGTLHEGGLACDVIATQRSANRTKGEDHSAIITRDHNTQNGGVSNKTDKVLDQAGHTPIFLGSRSKAVRCFEVHDPGNLKANHEFEIGGELEKNNTRHYSELLKQAVDSIFVTECKCRSDLCLLSVGSSKGMIQDTKCVHRRSDQGSATDERNMQSGMR